MPNGSDEISRRWGRVTNHIDSQEKKMPKSKEQIELEKEDVEKILDEIVSVVKTGTMLYHHFGSGVKGTKSISEYARQIYDLFKLPSEPAPMLTDKEIRKAVTEYENSIGTRISEDDISETFLRDFKVVTEAQHSLSEKHYREQDEPANR